MCECHFSFVIPRSVDNTVLYQEMCQPSYCHCKNVNVESRYCGWEQEIGQQRGAAYWWIRGPKTKGAA
jgi:hypothetical protein